MSAIIEQAIKENKVMVFSKTYCPFCTKAKKALSEINVTFEVMELDTRKDCATIQDALGKMTGARSVPRVFVGGKFIGGGDETAQLKKSGELKKMIDSL